MSWTSALPNWMQVPPPDGRSESQIDDDLEDEIGFHIEQIERELREAGQDAEAARGLARLRFGDVESIKRRCRRIALKERTMLQRVNFVMMAVVMLLVIGVGVQVMITQRYNTLALQAITTEITNMKYNALAAQRPLRADEMSTDQIGRTLVKTPDGRWVPVDSKEAQSAATTVQPGTIYIDGIVERPGQYMLPRAGALTLRRLLATAGGLKGGGAVRVAVTQMEADGSTRVRFKNDELERDGTDDFVLLPDDHVHVEYGVSTQRGESPTAKMSLYGLPTENGMWRQVDANGELIENGATIEYREYNDVRNLTASPTGILRLPGRSEEISLTFHGPGQSRHLAISVGSGASLQGRWQLDGQTLIINITPGVPEIVEPLRFVRDLNAPDQASTQDAKSD